MYSSIYSIELKPYLISQINISTYKQLSNIIIAAATFIFR